MHFILFALENTFQWKISESSSIFISSHLMTEKSDSTVLVPGNTDANPLHKRFIFWNCVPRIPHPPSKEVFEVQASKAVLMVPFLWYMQTSSRNSSWRPSSSCSLNAVTILLHCDRKISAKSCPLMLTGSWGKHRGVSKSVLAFNLSCPPQYLKFHQYDKPRLLQHSE